jgi:hypothetical protein
VPGLRNTHNIFKLAAQPDLVVVWPGVRWCPIAVQRMPAHSSVCLYAYAHCLVDPCCVWIHFTLPEHRSTQTRPMQRLERHTRTLPCRTCISTYKCTC